MEQGIPFPFCKNIQQHNLLSLLHGYNIFQVNIECSSLDFEALLTHHKFHLHSRYPSNYQEGNIFPVGIKQMVERYQSYKYNLQGINYMSIARLHLDSILQDSK